MIAPTRKPNEGGSISGTVQPGLKFKKDFAPSPYKPSGPGVARPNQGGTITKGGVTRNYAPSPAGQRSPASTAEFPAGPRSMAPKLGAAPGATTPGPQPYAQAGAAAPGAPAPAGITPTPFAGATPPGAAVPASPAASIGQRPTPTSPASKMGFSSRGAAAPRGDDIVSMPMGKRKNLNIIAPTPRESGQLGGRKFADPKARNPYDVYAAGLLGTG